MSWLKYKRPGRRLALKEVLDAGNVPERKSYPPRLLFMIDGLGISFLCGTIWILFAEYWVGIDPSNANKAFVADVFGDARKYFHKVPKSILDELRKHRAVR